MKENVPFLGLGRKHQFIGEYVLGLYSGVSGLVRSEGPPYHIVGQ